MYKVISFM